MNYCEKKMPLPLLVSSEMLEQQRLQELRGFQSALQKVERAIRAREAYSFRESWHARLAYLEKDSIRVIEQRHGDPDD